MNIFLSYIYPYRTFKRCDVSQTEEGLMWVELRRTVIIRYKLVQLRTWQSLSPAVTITLALQFRIISRPHRPGTWRHIPYTGSSCWPRTSADTMAFDKVCWGVCLHQNEVPERVLGLRNSIIGCGVGYGVKLLPQSKKVLPHLGYAFLALSLILDRAFLKHPMP